MSKARRKLLQIAAIALLLVVLSACGSKSQEGVLKKIEGKAGEIDGYKAAMQMTMKTGKDERNYDVKVWHKKADTDFFRVGLDNKGEEDGQVILKNEEGVFVLTPELKKSFKFQTEWPENSSQPYLYESLVEDVVSDPDATFTETENEYVFMTKTNYQNNTNMPYQEVRFDQKTFLPTAVNVMDKDQEPLISVTFDEIELDPSFAKDDFQREAILENTMADAEVSGEEEKEQVMEILFPLVTNGAELTEKEDIETEDGQRVIMTYEGEQNFTLIQEQPESLPTAKTAETVEEIKGDVVNLGHSIGALSGNTIEWSYQGADFLLASEDMTAEELVNVASSIQGKEVK